jgi:hypothetical protein
VLLAPSHWPVQAEPSPAHAWRDPCGAPLTGTQVPSEFGTSHASHCPKHGRLQQKPSTQRVELHSVFVLHESPFCFAWTHWPAAQYCPLPPLQSLSFTHSAPAQMSTSQPFTQSSCSMGGQSPWPLQKATRVARLPEHAAFRQTVPNPA